jgi:hypothetical protein
MFGRNKDNNENDKQKKNFIEVLKAIQEEQKNQPESRGLIPRNQELQVNPQQYGGLIKAILLFQSSSNDPEDTLFLSLTQAEVTLLGFCLNLFEVTAGGLPMYREMMVCLEGMAAKIAEAMTVQKVGNREDN